MFGSFRLYINLGNEAMQGPEDVAAALRTVADSRGMAAGIDEGTIFDLNGNRVGAWELVEDEEESRSLWSRRGGRRGYQRGRGR